MKLTQYTNTREQRASGVSINKQKGEFTQAAYQSISRGLGDLSKASKIIEEQQDQNNAQSLIAQRFKEAEMYKAKVKDNSRHGKVDPRKMTRYEGSSPVVDYKQIGGQNIHDGMDSVNQQFDTYASQNLSEKAYKIYKDSTLDSTVRDTLGAYNIYRVEMKQEQLRVASQTTAAIMSNVQVSDNPVGVAQGSQDELDKYYKSLDGNAFMSSAEVDAIVRTNNEQLFETTVQALIRNEDFDGASNQLHINTEMLNAIPEAEYKKWGLFWDKEHQVIRRDGRSPDSVLSRGRSIKHSPKGYGKFRLKGWTTYSTAKKEAMIGQILRGLVQTEEKKANTNIRLFKNITNDIFTGKADAKQMSLLNTTAQKIHQMDIKPEIKADLFAEAMAATAFSNNVAAMGVSDPAMIATSRAGIIKQMESINSADLFGDMLSDPDFATYVNDKSFKSNFKGNVLRMYDKVANEHIKARETDLFSYNLKYDTMTANAFKSLNRQGMTYATAVQELGKANEEGNLAKIKAANDNVVATDKAIKLSAVSTLAYADDYQSSLGIPHYERKYLPQGNVEELSKSVLAAIDTNDITTIVGSVGAIKGMIGGTNYSPKLMRSFFEQAGKKLPSVVQGSMLLPDELQGDLLANLPNIKAVYAGSGQEISQGDMDKALASNSHFEDLAKALSVGPNAKYNQRTLGALAQVAKVGAVEFLIGEGNAADALDKSIEKYVKATGYINNGLYISSKALSELNLSKANAEGFFNTANRMVKHMDFKPTEQTRERWVAAAYGPEKRWKDIDQAERKEYLERFAKDTTIIWSTDGEASFIHAPTGTPVSMKIGDEDYFTIDAQPAKKLFRPTADNKYYNKAKADIERVNARYGRPTGGRAW